MDIEVKKKEFMDQPEYKKYPDLLTSSLDLFLLPVDTFIKKFEKLKIKLGSDYVEKLASDEGLIEIMYEDQIESYGLLLNNIVVNFIGMTKVIFIFLLGRSILRYSLIAKNNNLFYTIIKIIKKRKYYG